MIAAVKRVLLTGMSGTGKTSVIRALGARGFKAVEYGRRVVRALAGRPPALAGGRD